MNAQMTFAVRLFSLGIVGLRKALSREAYFVVGQLRKVEPWQKQVRMLAARRAGQN